MSLSVLLVGGSPEASSSVLLNQLAGQSDVVVAVDRGLDAVLDAGLVPTLFCGDADSVSANGASYLERARDGSSSFEIEKYNPYKDATDLALALRAISERWHGERVIATSLSGGRPDHALGVLGCLARYDSGPIELVENAFSARFLHSGESWYIRGARNQTFSAISLENGSVISEIGMEWEVDHLTMDALSDRGVSNVVRSCAARIDCHRGSVIAFLLNALDA